MEYHPVEFFQDLYIFGKTFKCSNGGRHITYVIDGDLPSNNLLRWIIYTKLVMSFVGYNR